MERKSPFKRQIREVSARVYMRAIAKRNCRIYSKNNYMQFNESQLYYTKILIFHLMRLTVVIEVLGFEPHHDISRHIENALPELPSHLSKN